MTARAHSIPNEQYRTTHSEAAEGDVLDVSTRHGMQRQVSMSIPACRPGRYNAPFFKAANTATQLARIDDGKPLHT